MRSLERFWAQAEVPQRPEDKGKPSVRLSLDSDSEFSPVLLRQGLVALGLWEAGQLAGPLAPLWWASQ